MSDEVVRIQHIDIEYSVFAIAPPDGPVRIGYGAMCNMGIQERLIAYEVIAEKAQEMIARLERDLDEGK